AHDAHLTLVATAPETVVVVEFARRDVNLGLCLLDLGGPGLLGHDGRATKGGGARQRGTGDGGLAEKAAATAPLLVEFDRLLLVVLVFHDCAPYGCGSRPEPGVLLNGSVLGRTKRLGHDRNDQLLGCSLLALAALLVLQHQRRTLVLIVVGHLAIEAVMALVGIDAPVRMDGLDLALVGANLTGLTAFLAALEPVEQAQLGGNG